MKNVGRRTEHGPVSQLAWGFAAAALGYAVQVGNGHLNGDAIMPLTLAVALALAAVIGPFKLPIGSAPGTFVTAFLTAVLAFQFWHLLSVLPAIYLTDCSNDALQPFRQGIMIAAVLSGFLVAAERWQTRIFVFALVLLLHFTLGAWVLESSPKPYIDTFEFQKQAVEALLSGNNPYRISYRNIYPDESFYGPGLFVDNRSRFGYPYPPLLLYFATAGSLFGGDFRYSQLFAATLAGALIAALGSGRRSAMLAAMVFLFTPRGFFVLEQSWTEPYLVCLCAAVALSARRGWRATPWLAGLFLVAKQYTFLAAPLMLLLPKPSSLPSWRNFFGKAAISGAIVTLPLFLVGPKPFVRSIVVLQFLQPFRPDALSFPAHWGAHGDEALVKHALFVTAGCAIALSLWRSPRTTTGFCGALALTYLAFFSFAKQAFCGYYYFVIGALCCAISAASARHVLDLANAREVGVDDRVRNGVVPITTYRDSAHCGSSPKTSEWSGQRPRVLTMRRTR